MKDFIHLREAFDFAGQVKNLEAGSLPLWRRCQDQLNGLGSRQPQWL